MKKELDNHIGKIIDNINGYNIIDCKKCGFIHKTPLPDQKKWASFYSEEFYNWKDKILYLEDTEKDLVYREILHEDKYNNLKLLLNTKTQPSIIDIGAGGGLFVEYFNDKGWNAIGIEASKKATEFARKKGRNVTNIFVEEFLRLKRLPKYDVIHFREVLDNIINPYVVLKDVVNKLMHSKSILVVDTSNDYNPFQIAIHKVLKTRKWWIEADTINFFTTKSMQNIFNKVGLKICHIESTFPLELFALQGENYIENPELGKTIHLKRVLFEDNIRKAGLWDKKREFFNSLAKIGLGRNVIVYGMKNYK